MIGGFRSEYDAIMSLADRECPPPPEPGFKRRGRRKKGRERALIERLMERMDSVCMFIEDFRVPFDNNQAERDVRNVKTKAKVAGCFRTPEGAQNYLTVMSYIGTCRKHGIDAYQAMKSAFEGNPDKVL